MEQQQLKWNEKKRKILLNQMVDTNKATATESHAEITNGRIEMTQSKFGMVEDNNKKKTDKQIQSDSVKRKTRYKRTSNGAVLFLCPFHFASYSILFYQIQCETYPIRNLLWCKRLIVTYICKGEEGEKEKIKEQTIQQHKG